MTTFKRLLSYIVLGGTFCLSNLNAVNASVPQVVQHPTDHNFAIWHIKDSHLPIISIKFAFTKCGFAYDPDDKQGLAFRVSSMLNEGAGSYNSSEYVSELEKVATSLNFHVDADNFYIHLKTLSSHLERALYLLQIALVEPHFDVKAHDRVYNQIKILLKQKQEDPYYVGGRTLYKQIFGTHPYGRSRYGTDTGNKRINEADLHGFVKQCFAKNNLVTSAVGDLHVSDLDTVAQTFATLTAQRAWHITSLEKAKFLAPKSSEPTKVIMNIPQSIILFALPNTGRSDANYYNSYVLNYLLGGGGFESLLMQKLRDEKGLVYSARSSINVLDQLSFIDGTAATKSASASQAIQTIAESFAHIQANGVDEDRVNLAKRFIQNSFPLNLIRNASVASYLQTMQLHNLGANYLQNRNKYINDTSRSSISSVAQQLYNPSQIHYVIVGKE